MVTQREKSAETSEVLAGNSMADHRPLYGYLAFAGSLPFVVGAGLLALNIEQLPFLGSLTQALIFYTLVIVSFMAGAHWGQHLSFPSPWKRRLPILSNTIAVMAWLLAIVLSPASFFTAAALMFVGVLWIDRRLYQASLISTNYFRVRLWVTVVVVLSLVVVSWFCN